MDRCVRAIGYAAGLGDMRRFRTSVHPKIISLQLVLTILTLIVLDNQDAQALSVVRQLMEKHDLSSADGPDKTATHMRCQCAS